MLVLLLVQGAVAGGTAAAHEPDALRWQRHAGAVTIVRDTWGIAHVYGKTDADAVFGAMYAQAEDDFARIERNYLVSLGWLGRAEGESALYGDLQHRLFVDPSRLQVLYRGAPQWLKTLMVAWADGLNFFLATHPRVAPRVIHRFEPWMALSFTEGSIGGDIETVDRAALQKFYGGAAPPAVSRQVAVPGRLPAASNQVAVPGRLPAASEPVAVPGAPPAASEPVAVPGGPPAASNQVAVPGGSNGFAIAPSRSASGHALLWINPHTSFYFRSELQMVSEEGLNVYGAATWGQFFIYQGFNSRNGWMHTSYGGDAIDEYAETVTGGTSGFRYRYGGGFRKLTTRRIAIRFKRGGTQVTRDFKAFFTHHGPIVRAAADQWIAVKLFEDPVRALEQSYLRTKTAGYDSFLAIQSMRTDTSNNTVYADVDGTIAYFHGNFIPKRDPQFDYTQPVDGSDPRTEWHGPHAIADTITLLNPASGWIQNTNNWPFSAAGASSPKRDDYPAYMWTRGENPRGIHAVQVLQDIRDVTLDSLIAAGYDSRLTAFDTLLPPLLEAYGRLAPDDPRRARLSQPIAVLAGWDRRTSADSVATSLAIYWGEILIDRNSEPARSAHQPAYDYVVGHSTDAARLEALVAALDSLERDFGSWQKPWGELNRFQRLTGDVEQPFDDAKPSLAVGFAPGQWGALASFDSSKPRTTRKIYGSVGNSFVAAVEFASPIRAKALLSGGESGDPASPHFADQAALFTQGRFRDVFFTPAQVSAHAERTYRPGDGALRP